jgi:hypothetical protein
MAIPRALLFLVLLLNSLILLDDSEKFDLGSHVIWDELKPNHLTWYKILFLLYFLARIFST